MADKEAGGSDTGPRGERRVRVLRLRRGGRRRDEARSAPRSPLAGRGKVGAPAPPFPSRQGRGHNRGGAGSPGGHGWRAGHVLRSQLGCGHCGEDRSPRPDTPLSPPQDVASCGGPMHVWVRTVPHVRPLRAMRGLPRWPFKRSASG